jgi:hypothetical protein
MLKVVRSLDKQQNGSTKALYCVRLDSKSSSCTLYNCAFWKSFVTNCTRNQGFFLVCSGML